MALAKFRKIINFRVPKPAPKPKDKDENKEEESK